ncbi:hypothetical protein BKA70DRAFT_1162132 [Coprinopsis sp. MPI-PUGE-AT-0042]|nr:hypothetical protein BKA70DRAFT_1162132 [Coprinopsis sp. MPI-PUGE-AT-0042]
MSSPLTSIHASDDDQIALINLNLDMKACKGCRKLNIRAGSKYVNCPSCRSKKNEQKRKRNAEILKIHRRLQELDANTLMHVESDDDDAPLPSTSAVISRPTMQSKVKAERKERVEKVSPMVSTALKDLEGERKRVALRMMKEHLKAAAARQEVTWKTQDQAIVGTEYQNATELYSAVKAAVLHGSESSKRVRFQGCHSLVRKEGINHPERAEYVTKDVRKIGGALFEHQKPISTDSSSNKTVLTYRCACKGYKTIAPPTLTTVIKPEPKKSSASLLNWARSHKKQMAAATSAVEGETKLRIECHGTVVVTVEDDDSHPHDLPGQRIHVAIHHPKNKSAV